MFKKIVFSVWGVISYPIRHTKIGSELLSKINSKATVMIRKKRAYNELIEMIQKKVDLQAPATNDEKYMILSGSSLQKVGIFCDLQYFVRWIRICEQIHYKPIIDMKNVPNQYLEDNMIGTENSWEYYFLQPNNAELSKAYSSSNRIIVNCWDKPKFKSAVSRKLWNITNDEDIYNNKETQLIYKELYQRNIKLNSETNNYIESIWRSFGTSPEDKVLGLMCRGTDYFRLKPYGHNIQPSIEMIIQKIKEIQKVVKVDYIYLATEDYEIWQALNKEFHEQLRYINCPRIKMNTNNELISDSFEKEGIDRKQRGLDYIASIYMLEKCDYLMTGITCATDSIILMKDKNYEYTHIWELGKYGVDDKE